MERLPTTSEHYDETEGASGTQSVLGSLCSRAPSSQIDRFTQRLERLGEDKRACFSAATNEARAFFTDLIEMNKRFKTANGKNIFTRPGYANDYIKPVIIRMNQRAVTIQGHCRQLFDLLGVTDDKDKDIIVEAILNSVFRKKDPVKECNSKKEEGFRIDSETLMFFIGHVDGYKKTKALDNTHFVNVDITIGEALGGLTGTVAKTLMSGFPNFTLAIDCTYGTLISVLNEQLINSTI